jgi:hypothetical protein
MQPVATSRIEPSAVDYRSYGIPFASISMTDVVRLQGVAIMGKDILGKGILSLALGVALVGLTIAMIASLL